MSRQPHRRRSLSVVPGKAVATFLAGYLVLAVVAGVSWPAGAGATHLEVGGAARPVGLHAPKAPPPKVGEPAANAAAAATVRYFYAGGYHREGPATTAAGARALMTIHRPTLASDEYHSLAELAITSADQKQIVEVGWTVDRNLYGDSLPRLFVFHWVDGMATCYNACGFVQSGQAEPGMVFPTGAQQWPFAINHETNPGRWWITVGFSIVGYFPDSLWDGNFTKPGYVQVFGEVAGNDPTPCTDMGTGVFPTSTTGALINQVNLLPLPGPAVNLTAQTSTPDYYKTIKTGPRSLRYGGPGAC